MCFAMFGSFDRYRRVTRLLSVFLAHPRGDQVHHAGTSSGMTDTLGKMRIADQTVVLRRGATQAFCNSSTFTPHHLRAQASRPLHAVNREGYLVKQTASR